MTEIIIVILLQIECVLFGAIAKKVHDFLEENNVTECNVTLNKMVVVLLKDGSWGLLSDPETEITVGDII